MPTSADNTRFERLESQAANHQAEIRVLGERIDSTKKTAAEARRAAEGHAPLIAVLKSSVENLAQEGTATKKDTKDHGERIAKLEESLKDKDKQIQELKAEQNENRKWLKQALLVVFGAVIGVVSTIVTVFLGLKKP